MPPFGCSVALHSLSCFSLPCFLSLQPTLSCNKASLITATLHFRASLLSASLHFIPPPFFSAFCSPPAALFSSPAGRYGLRLTLFNCLHFVLAIKAVASCSALQAVMVFAKKSKNPASLPLPHVPSIGFVPQPSCPPPLLNSQWLRRVKPSGAKKNCTLWLALLAHGCYNLLFTTHKNKKKRKISQYQCFNKYTKTKCKVTGLQAKADKGSLRQPQKIFLFLLPEKQKVKTKRVFFGLPLHLCLSACGIQALCLTVFFAVGWLAGGWLPTLVVRFASTFLISVVPFRWFLFSSCGCNSLLVSCLFRWLTLFFCAFGQKKQGQSQKSKKCSKLGI